jgi:geranylgeranyl pyrophosphate synthase
MTIFPLDDGDMHPGRPACHIAFDEATTNLAGDSLRPGLGLRSWRRHRPATDKNWSIIFICSRCRRRSWQSFPQILRRFSSYGRKIGLAFQIADDILDHTATQEFATKPTRQP